MICPRCAGHGRIFLQEGKGSRTIKEAPTQSYGFLVECPTCGGDGRVNKRRWEALQRRMEPERK